MVYALNDDVYIVNGKAKSCIYDFNSSKLYSINDALSRELNLVNMGKTRVGSINKELKTIFDQLMQLGILINTDKPVERKINEIALRDRELTFAWIEITSKCNLRCKHCYNESDIHCDKVMSLQNYKQVIDNLLELGIQKVQIIGGEPFFDNIILKEMLDYTVGKFQIIEIFTNGTLIPKDWFGYLAQNNIRMALSIYSYDEKIHDSITKVKGSWQRTNQTIAELSRLGIQYRVCNVLMKGVALGEQTTNLYSLSADKDIVRMSGRANFALLTDELIRKKLITKDSFGEAITKSFCASLVSGHNCFRSRLYISADMVVYPCVMERRLKHCSINHGQKISIDDTILHLTKDKIDKCSHCEYRYACFDCRPNSLSGCIYEKPWYCTYDPDTGEWGNVEEFIEDLRSQWSSTLSNGK